MDLFGSNWASPVTSKSWAFAATVLDRLKRASGYRLFVHSAHHAWERAITPDATWNDH